MIKHIIHPCFCIVLLCFAVATAVTGRAQNPGGVRLFQGPNATGEGQDIPAGTFRVDGKQLGSSVKDAVFSVQVGKGYRVRFCESAGSVDTGEKCEEFGEGTANLKSINFNAIKVWRVAQTAAAAAVIVYEAPNWDGRSQVFNPGMYRSDRNEFGKIGDNLARSVAVAKGFIARFCVDEGIKGRGAGDCEEHEAGRHNLRFANSISFIEVIDLTDKSPDAESAPVVLYEDNTQGGRRQGFDVGTFLASLNQLNKIGNDRASSVTVKNGYRVLICADEITGEAPSDKCEELGPGKHNLRIKDAASYVKVWKLDK